MSAPTVCIPVVHARKTAGGAVVAYADERMEGEPVKVWSLYATDRPDMRERYVNINHKSYRILWHS